MERTGRPMGKWERVNGYKTLRLSDIGVRNLELRIDFNQQSFRIKKQTQF